MITIVVKLYRAAVVRRFDLIRNDSIICVKIPLQSNTPFTESIQENKILIVENRSWNWHHLYPPSLRPTLHALREKHIRMTSFANVEKFEIDLPKKRRDIEFKRKFRSNFTNYLIKYASEATDT